MLILITVRIWCNGEYGSDDDDDYEGEHDGDNDDEEYDEEDDDDNDNCVYDFYGCDADDDDDQLTMRISLVPIYFAGSGSDQEIVLKMAKLFGHEDSFLRKVSNVPLRLF